MDRARARTGSSIWLDRKTRNASGIRPSSRMGSRTGNVPTSDVVAIPDGTSGAKIRLRDESSLGTDAIRIAVREAAAFAAPYRFITG